MVDLVNQPTKLMRNKNQLVDVTSFIIQVATTLLVAGLTLTLWIPGQTLLDPPARNQTSFKCCPYNCRQLAYSLVQLVHVM